MLFVKLQFIFHHHLISHVEDAIEDDMGVFLPRITRGRERERTFKLYLYH